MTSYAMPALVEPPKAEPGVVYAVASGDLRPSANLTCWPAQQKLEADFSAAVESLGWSVRRGHPLDPVRGHGFIDSQRAGIEVFKGLPVDVTVEILWADRSRVHMTETGYVQMVRASHGKHSSSVHAAATRHHRS